MTGEEYHKCSMCLRHSGSVGLNDQEKTSAKEFKNILGAGGGSQKQISEGWIEIITLPKDLTTITTSALMFNYKKVALLKLFDDIIHNLPF